MWRAYTDVCNFHIYFYYYFLSQYSIPREEKIVLWTIIIIVLPLMCKSNPVGDEKLEEIQNGVQ